jgi:O-antigen ligase
VFLAAAVVMALAGPATWALGVDDRPWAAAAAAGALLAYAAARRLLGADDIPLALPFAGAFALLWAGAALSLVERLEVNAALALVATGALSAVAADIARRDRGPEWVMAGAALALGAVAAVALGAWLTGFRDLVPYTLDSQARLSWPFTHPNHLGVICAALLPLAIVAAVGARRPAPRLAACLAIALGLGALALSASRTGWIGAAVGAAVVAAYGPARRAVAFGAVATLALASPVISERAGDADLGLDNLRLQIWKDALTAFAEHPITGVGLNGFADHARPLEQAGAPIPQHAHELFLGRAAELGILGLAGIVALLALTFVASHRGARGPAGGRRLLGIGTAASLAVIVVVGLLDDPLHRHYAQLLLWVVVGLAAAAGARRTLVLRTGRPEGSK